MIKGYFDSYSYHTPEKEHLSVKDKLLLNNRIYFILKYAHVVLRTRKEAIKKIYDTKAWADSSFEIFRFIEKTGGKFILQGWRISINRLDRFCISAIT